MGIGPVHVGADIVVLTVFLAHFISDYWNVFGNWRDGIIPTRFCSASPPLVAVEGRCQLVVRIGGQVSKKLGEIISKREPPKCDHIGGTSGSNGRHQLLHADPLPLER